MDRYEPHPVAWTPDRVSRFWDWRSAQGEAGYFSAMAGKALLGLVRSTRVPVAGRILDFGCGMGHFMATLYSEGVICEGADFSARSVELASAKLTSLGSPARVNQLRGLPTDFEAESFDLVFLLETIEHLSREDSMETLTELFRIIRPGGILVVTTPNHENLQGNLTICPDCGAIFHPIQHVSTWTAESLEASVNAYGFDTVLVRDYYLLESWTQSRLASWAARAFGRSLPNLVYIGRRNV